jgi:hypothetical protein
VARVGTEHSEFLLFRADLTPKSFGVFFVQKNGKNSLDKLNLANEFWRTLFPTLHLASAFLARYEGSYTVRIKKELSPQLAHSQN